MEDRDRQAHCQQRSLNYWRYSLSLSLTWDPPRMTCHAHQLNGEGPPSVKGPQHPAAGLQPTSILIGRTRFLQLFDILGITPGNHSRGYDGFEQGLARWVNCKSP